MKELIVRNGKTCHSLYMPVHLTEQVQAIVKEQHSSFNAVALQAIEFFLKNSSLNVVN